MTQSDVPVPIDPASGRHGQAGSASTDPSGRAVLGAWFLSTIHTVWLFVSRTVFVAWFVSAVAHTVVFLAMVWVVFPYTARDVSDLPLAHTDILGELEATSLVPSQLPDLSSQIRPETPSDMRFAPKKFERLSELTMTKRPDLSIIGIGAGGGDFSRYGLRVGGGPGPEFFGAGGSSARGARRIIYVVDRSGSMLDTFDYVREELQRSIAALRRSQKFHVIFFSSGKPIESPPGRLISAIRAQKEAFFEFLKGIAPSGGTEPGSAMRRALANEPDLIYFLTDGQFDRSLVEKLDKWNKQRRTQIFTIAYVDRVGADLLELIAREHGGKFKFVSENDLP